MQYVNTYLEQLFGLNTGTVGTTVVTVEQDNVIEQNLAFTGRIQVTLEFIVVGCIEDKQLLENEHKGSLYLKQQQLYQDEYKCPYTGVVTNIKQTKYKFSCLLGKETNEVIRHLLGVE